MIHIVVALAQEAKPVRAHFRMRQMECGVFPLYHTELAGGLRLRLIVSGSGKLNAAMAAAYLQGLSPNTMHAWINAGTAGAAHLPLGHVALAHKVIDRGSGQCWYPFLAPKPICATDNVISVDEPETAFEHPVLYDMEAAGLLSAACRFSTVELIRVIKVVSDNLEHRAAALSAADLSRHMHNTLPLLETQCRLLAALLDHDPLQGAWIEALHNLQLAFHFTRSQQVQLEQLLRRWFSLNTGAPAIESCKDGKSVLQTLHKQLQAQLPRL